MKFFFTYIIITILLTVSVFSFCNAKPNIGEGTGIVGNQAGYDTKNVNDTTLSATVGKVIEAILALVGTIFFILTVYAGILWMTARGKDEQVEKATKIFQTSIIGLVVIVGAYSITHYVLKAVFSVSGIK